MSENQIPEKPVKLDREKSKSVTTFLAERHADALRQIAAMRGITLQELQSSVLEDFAEREVVELLAHQEKFFGQFRATQNAIKEALQHAKKPHERKARSASVDASEHPRSPQGPTA